MSLNVNTRGSSNSLTNSNHVIRQVERELYRLYGTIAPFVTMLRMMTMSRSAKAKGRKSTSKIINLENPKFEWSEKDPGTPYGIAQAAYNSVVTSIVVDDASMFTVRDIIYVRSTEEQLLVTAVDETTDTLTVTRGFAGTTAAAIPDGETLILQSGTFAEGTGAPKSISFNPTMPYNYSQIFKKSVENTRTGLQTREYGNSNKMEELRRDAWEEFIQERARQYYFGKRSIDTSGSTPVRTTGGLNEFITTNVEDFSGSFTYSKWMDFVEILMRYGGMDKILFTSSELLKAIQLEVVGNTEMPISPKSKEYGVNIKRLTTAFGDLDIAYDRTLDYYCENGHGVGFALETSLIEEMVMQPDVWKENVQDPDEDGRKDQIIGECGLKVRLQKRHGKIVL